MPAVSFAKSVGVDIRLSSLGSGKAKMIAAACQNFGSLSKLSWPVATMEPRGFGKSVVSDFEVEKTGLSHYLGDFDAAFKAAKLRKGPLFAYSHMGYFAVYYALSRPSSLSGLVLVEPALFTDTAELEKRARLAEGNNGAAAIGSMLGYVDRKTGLRTAAAETATKSIMAQVQSSKTLAREFRIRAEQPLSAKDLSTLSVPTLLIGGTESSVKFMVAEAAKLIPDASVWWVQGAGHLDLMDKKYADQISQVVDSFVSSL